MQGLFLSDRKNGLVVKIKCKSEFLKLSIISSGDLWLVLPFLDPAPWLPQYPGLLAPGEGHMLIAHPLRLGGAEESWELCAGYSICQDLYVSG